MQARLYPPPRPRGSTRCEPDYAALHQELKRPGVTLQLLWEEYRAGTAGQAYRYSAFCDKYRTWAKRLKRSMRQIHPGGERLFVDYAGQTVPVVDASTGEIRRAQVFVAVLGAGARQGSCRLIHAASGCLSSVFVKGRIDLPIMTRNISRGIVLFMIVLWLLN